jgi:hypothetical protein
VLVQLRINRSGTLVAEARIREENVLRGSHEESGNDEQQTAMGSPKANLCEALLKQFAWPVIGGLAAGSLLAMTGSKFLRIALFGISNLDPIGFIGGVGVLLVVVVLSGVVPTRRAMRLNLARALHRE